MFMYVYVVGIRVRVLCNLWSNLFEKFFFFLVDPLTTSTKKKKFKKNGSKKKSLKKVRPKITKYPHPNTYNISIHKHTYMIIMTHNKILITNSTKRA